MQFGCRFSAPAIRGWRLSAVFGLTRMSHNAQEKRPPVNTLEKSLFQCGFRRDVAFRPAVCARTFRILRVFAGLCQDGGEIRRTAAIAPGPINQLAIGGVRLRRDSVRRITISSELATTNDQLLGGGGQVLDKRDN